MKDVEKTNVERQNSRKRLRRRKRMMNVYSLVVLILVVTAGITISYTFLFNINEIRVSGESDMYSAEEIVMASGIHDGDNLLRLDTKKSEQLILDNLLYVETASVNRDFPSSVEITVTRCVPAFNVNYEEGTLVVSKNGKILEDNGFVTDGLPIIYGYEPSVTQKGKPITSDNEHKNAAFAELIRNIVSSDDAVIATVDMSDEQSIIVNYKNGIVFKMGSWSDVEYKLSLAATVMKDDSVKGKKGYLTMVGTNQCSFRTSNEPAAIPEATTVAVTDGSGNEVGGESNPEQEAIFSEYNNRDNNDQDTADDENYDDGGNDGGYWGADSADNYDWNDYSDDGYYDDSYNNWNNYDDSYGYYEGDYSDDYGQW